MRNWLQRGSLLAITLLPAVAGADPLPEPDEPPCSIATSKKPGETCVICKRDKLDADLCHTKYESVGYAYRCSIDRPFAAHDRQEVWCRAKKKTHE